MRSATRAVLATAVLVCALAPRAFAVSHPAVGEAAPSFRLPGLAADTVASDSLAGRLVYVDFWASWCVPCRRSFPFMQKLEERFGARGLAVVAINLDQDRGAANKFLAAYPSTFHVAFDPAGVSARAFGVDGMPTSLLVGRDGKVLERHVGFEPKAAHALEERIEKELAP